MSVPIVRASAERDPPWHDLPGSIAQMLLACDASGRAETVSRQWQRYTGQSAADAVGQGWLAVLDDDDRARLCAAWRDGVPGREAFDLEVGIRRHDGRRRLFRLIASPFDEAPHGGLWCVCATDIDAMRRASVERDRALATLQAHIAELPIGFMRFDLAMRVRDLNPAAERIFGWRREELIGRSAFGTIVAPAQSALVESIVAALKTSDGPVSSINENDDRHGRRIVCEWSSTLEHDEDDRPSGIRSTVVDVTERVRDAERQARDARRVAQLSRRLISAQEDERKALALELHDELGQQLAALRIGLSSLAMRAGQGRTPQDGPQLAACLSIVEDAIARVRRRALELRPAMLEEIGLAGTLDWYCAQQQERFGVPVRLVAVPPAGALPQSVVVAAFRIVQEAVSNALRHGAPSEVTVSVCQPGRRQLRVAVGPGTRCGRPCAKTSPVVPHGPGVVPGWRVRPQPGVAGRAHPPCRILGCG